MTQMSARDRVSTLFDDFEEEGVTRADRQTPLDPISFPGYAEDQMQVRERRAPDESDESVLAGIATLEGHRFVSAVFDFGFYGGSMGVAAGRRLEAAMALARQLRLPFLALTTSGGARMQEGMAALAQMPRAVSASLELANSHIPRIAILGDPTTGGVYSSFAAISDVIVAEAEATIGFAGPRIAERISGQRLPPGSHTAEKAFEAGLVDAVVESAELRSTIRRLIRVLGRRDPQPTHNRASQEKLRRDPPGEAPEAQLDTWEQFELARHPQRPSPRFYIEKLAQEPFELHGDRQGSDDPATITIIGLFEERPALFVAFDRRRPTAGGFRKASRAIRLASRLGLRVVTLIDTPGADPTFGSEYSGLASAIADTFAACLQAEVPLIAAVVGEGGSGGALTLACGDVVGIQKHAVFSVIAPEGAAEILYRDPTRAREIASMLKPTSSDLIQLGLADEIIPEPEPGAHADPEASALMLKDWLKTRIDTRANIENRRNRFRL